MLAKHLTTVHDTAANLAAQNEVFGPNVIVFDEYGHSKRGDGVTPYNTLSGATNRGSSPVSTVNVQELGDGRDITTVLTLTDFIVGALAGDTTNLAIGNKVYTFPAGAHFLTVAYKSISLKCAGTAVAFDLGLGSVIGSGANAVLSGVGATAEDYLTGVATTSSPTGGTAVAQLAAVTAAIATNVAASVKDVFLNAGVAPNANNTGNLTASGIITLKWTRMS